MKCGNGKSGKSMQVDSDIGYIGEYHDGYNYDTYYPQFGGDLGMLECVNLNGDLVMLKCINPGLEMTAKCASHVNVDEHAKTHFKAPKMITTGNAGIAEALHEAMRYKPTKTFNRYAAL